MQWNPSKTIRRFFSAQTLQARREWHNIFRVLENKKSLKTKITLSGKIIIQNQRGNRVSNKSKS